MKTVLMRSGEMVRLSLRERLTDRQSTAGPDYHKGGKRRKRGGTKEKG